MAVSPPVCRWDNATLSDCLTEARREALGDGAGGYDGAIFSTVLGTCALRASPFQAR
jgi:hypothetical protein